jgi:Ca2+-binding EF-hand superfamily protein
MQKPMLVSALAVIAILGTSLAASAERGDRRHGMGMGGHGMGMMPGMEAMFDNADADGDGKITSEEFAAAAQARFTAADTDGDGQLSVEEMAAAAEARREAARQARQTAMMESFIDRRDTNDDGQLSFEEMTPGDADGRFFDRFDKDGDGTVSQDEIRQSMRDHGGFRGRDREMRHHN